MYKHPLCSICSTLIWGMIVIYNLVLFFCIYVFILSKKKIVYTFVYTLHVFIFSLLWYCFGFYICSMFGFRFRFVFSSFISMILVPLTNGNFFFLIQKQLVNEYILFMCLNIMDHYVLTVAQCEVVHVIFDLWMFQTWFDTFALIMNFLNHDWISCHATIGLFEALEINGISVAKIMKPFMVEF
jgi:hypothetical protein